MATQQNVSQEGETPLSPKEATSREDSSYGVTFTPLLYKQRYNLGLRYVENMAPLKLVDFGCAEGKFIWQLRDRNFPFLQQILGVDIDKPTLKRCQNVAKPNKGNMNVNRNTPLRIGLYCGSLTQWDSRLEGVEFVSLIEVIEHLEEDILAQLPAAIFGTLKPKYVFVTTPNSEFNILFKNFSGFRHPDHKFEWNREQFMTWCEAVCHNFPYQVEYSGVGEPPIGFEEVGYCSQAAFFSIKPELNTKPTIDMEPNTEEKSNKIESEIPTQIGPKPELNTEQTHSHTGDTDMELSKETQEPKTTGTESEMGHPIPKPELEESNMELTYREVICKEFPFKTDEPSSAPNMEPQPELTHKV